MAAPAIWQPKEEGLREICSLLEQHISPTCDNSRIWQQLQHYCRLPDFNNYLAFILARAQGNSVEIRQAAGLLLKNNLRSNFKATNPAYQQYIKSELLPCIGSTDKHIRTTVGTIISVVVEKGGICGWPELLQALVQCLDGNNMVHMEGALDTLSKICEDVPQELLVDVPGLVERPINVFLPKLFQFFQSPHGSLRKLSLESVDHLIMLMPNALYLSMDQYIHGLFILAHDPVVEEGESIPDRDQDLKPRFHSSRVHGLEDMKDDNDDSLYIRNLRKCSTAGLEVLSEVYGDDVLPTLMPLVQAKLSNSDEGTWKEREAAALALGAIAESCIRGSYPHLAEIVEFLIPLLDDQFPLPRSTTCWTLSRFSKPIVRTVGKRVGVRIVRRVQSCEQRKMVRGAGGGAGEDPPMLKSVSGIPEFFGRIS